MNVGSPITRVRQAAKVSGAADERSKRHSPAALEFVEQNRIALFLGPAGLGKTHLALAIGVLAAKAGHRVYCAGLKQLIHEVETAKQRGSLDVLFRRILSSALWIIVALWGVAALLQVQTSRHARAQSLTT